MKISKLPDAFLDLLQQDSSDAQVVIGAWWGMWLGLNPIATLHWFAMLALGLVIRFNLTAFGLGYVSFWILSWATAPLCHAVGLWLLGDVPALQPYWERFYHAPLLPFTRFNNTVVLGSLVLSTIISIPFTYVLRTNLANLRRFFTRNIEQTALWERLTFSRNEFNYGKKRK